MILLHLLCIVAGATVLRNVDDVPNWKLEKIRIIQDPGASKVTLSRVSRVRCSFASESSLNTLSDFYLEVVLCHE
jgi:hypothetical protein